jgi:hypothetical protein
MAQTETQERTTISLPKEDSESLVKFVLRYAGDFAWLIGWLGLGIAVITAFNSPPTIVAQVRGSIIIEGVDFRVVLGSLFLMGLRTIFQGLIWLGKNAKSLLAKR